MSINALYAIVIKQNVWICIIYTLKLFVKKVLNVFVKN